MAGNKISRVTAYKLQIGDFNEVELKSFYLVTQDKSEIDQIECEYQLHFLNQYIKEASWFGVFREQFSDLVEDVVQQVLMSGFILIVKVNGSSFYGVTGGGGHFHLKNACKIEPRFGIDLAESILSLPELKGLVQKDTSGEVNYLSRAFRGLYNPNGDVNNLKRVLTHVRGSLSKVNEFYELIGRSITAGDSLSVNGAKSFNDILRFIINADHLWLSGEKKINIPQLEYIDNKRDSELSTNLYEKLVECLCYYSRDETKNLFLDNEEIGYLPDRVVQYRLIYSRQSHLAETYEDVFEKVSFILREMNNTERVNAFQRMNLELTFDDEFTAKQSLVYFICGDVEHENNVYFITNKRWYKASEEYIGKLNNELDNIEHIFPEELGLVEWNEDKFAGRKAENDYNRANNSFLLLDRYLVEITGERGGIEFCDLLGYDHNKEIHLIHVKNECGAALRSLFAQGFISAKLYAESVEFRENIHSGRLRGADDTFRDAAQPLLRALSEKHKREIKIVFAIFDSKPSHVVPVDAKVTTEHLRGTLTTFAKVDLLERVTAIRAMGFAVAVTRIRPYPAEN